MNEKTQIVKSSISTYPQHSIQNATLAAALRMQPGQQILSIQQGEEMLHSVDALPFATGSLDVVVCESVICYVADAARLIAECGRVLKPGGQLGVLDTIAPDKYKAARYCNLFASLRDPRHIWAYNLREWKKMLDGAGLQPGQVQKIAVPQMVGVWASGCDEATLLRLRAMLIQAPLPVREWYGITAQPGWSALADVPFTLQQGLIVAAKK